MLRVAPKTWAAFRLTTLEGKSGVAAGSFLGIPASQVFVYQFRVQKLLEQEVSRLDNGSKEPEKDNRTRGAQRVVAERPGNLIR